MGNKPPPPPQPQKTVKELVKESTRSINRLRRDFQRESNKVEFSNTKIRNEIQRMVEKKEPRSAIRIVAQNILKNNQMQQKYSRLDAQLSNALFQLQSAATTDALVGVMRDVGQIFKMSTDKIDVKNIQQSLEMFTMEVEKQEALSEQINDIMSQDEDEITDDEADKIINQVEATVKGSGGGGLQNGPVTAVDKDLTNIEDRLKNL